MSKHRFILTPEQCAEDVIQLTDEDVHHCRTVRLQPGEIILVADGQSKEYKAEIIALHKKTVELKRLEEISNSSESSFQIALYQGYAKGSKLETVIQKATELGVARITPMVTSFSQIKLKEDREQKLKRYREVARQATRQCGRICLPEITTPLRFQDCVDQVPQDETSILFHNRTAGRLFDWKSLVAEINPQKKLHVFVGPEGGFSEEEIKIVEMKKIKIVKLGPRIMRSETAGIVAVTLAQLAWGDL